MKLNLRANSNFTLEAVVSGDRKLPGVTVEWVSPEPKDTRRLASDFAFVDGRWLDVEHWRYWIGTRRPRDRKEWIDTEAILRVSNAYVTPGNNIVTDAGVNFNLGMRGSVVPGKPISDNDVLGHYSGVHGTALLNSLNYGHWLLQRLPRFLTLRDQAPGVPILNSQWGDSTLLARIGLSESDVERYPEASRNQYVHVDELLVPTHLARPGLHRVIDSNRLDTVSDAFSEGIPDDPTLPALLYVARRPTDFRSGATNKDEFQSYVESLGFTTWYPIDDPIERQIQHFRAATVVITEVGSQALTSMFAGPDTTVIVVTPAISRGFGAQQKFAPRWRQWQRVICEARGQHYAQLLAAENTSYDEYEINLSVLSKALETYPNRIW